MRDGDRTMLTMANDYKGELTELLVVQCRPCSARADPRGERVLIEHLDAYTATVVGNTSTRIPAWRVGRRCSADGSGIGASRAVERAKALGVTIEAQYTVGEYDILILSARESDGLETWLRENDYRVPPGAARVLGTYLKLGMKFFVAKVNLKEQSALGFTHLRRSRSPARTRSSCSPIRLGMANANGPQELFVYALTRTGRVETTNYRTVRLPSGNEVPLYVKEEFSDFYRAMFQHQVEREDMRAVFLWYAWTWVGDPCRRSARERRAELEGVFWLSPPTPFDQRWGRPAPSMPPSGPQDVFVAPPPALRLRSLPRGSGLPGDR
ncbi:MAG: DUF2330 domain-containing protein [Candidatus Eisenbacteria bacterium]